MGGAVAGLGRASLIGDALVPIPEVRCCWLPLLDANPSTDGGYSMAHSLEGYPRLPAYATMCVPGCARRPRSTDVEPIFSTSGVLMTPYGQSDPRGNNKCKHCGGWHGGSV